MLVISVLVVEIAYLYPNSFTVLLIAFSAKVIYRWVLFDNRSNLISIQSNTSSINPLASLELELDLDLEDDFLDEDFLDEDFLDEDFLDELGFFLLL